MQRETIAKQRKHAPDMAAIVTNLYRLQADSVCHFRHMIMTALLAREITIWQALELARQHAKVCTDSQECAQKVVVALRGISSTLSQRSFEELLADPTLTNRIIIRALRRGGRKLTTPQPNAKRPKPARHEKQAMPPRKLRQSFADRFADKHARTTDLQLGYIGAQMLQH